MSKKQLTILLDKLGMCTSMICMLHCLSIPLFFILGFDTLLRVVDQEWVESAIIAFALAIGLISFMGGFFRHRQHFIPVLFVAGFLLLVNGEAVSQTWLALVLSTTGAIIIAYAHFQNLKWKRRAFSP